MAGGTRTSRSLEANIGCSTRCFYCMVFFLIKLVCVIILALLLTAIIFAVKRPKAVTFHVSDASLTQFNYTNNSTLHYHLALNITIRNPHKKLSIFYDHARFAFHTLDPFYQGHKNTTVLTHVFKGHQPVALRAAQVSELDTEKAKGVYDIQLELYLKTRHKLGRDKLKTQNHTVICDLHVPFTSSNNNNGTSSAAAFRTAACEKLVLTAL